MKKVLCMVAMLAMAAAIMMTVTGCASKHESEYDEHQKELEAALEEYVNNYETGGAEDKVPDPNAPARENIIVYIPAEGNTGLEQKLEDVPEISDEAITDKLIEVGVLPETAELIGFDPTNHVITYTGISRLTPREAMAVINTYTEAFEFPEQWEIKIDDETVIKSGYCDDWKNIDDTFEGGAEDFDAEVSAGGPGVE